MDQKAFTEEMKNSDFISWQRPEKFEKYKQVGKIVWDHEQFEMSNYSTSLKSKFQENDVGRQIETLSSILGVIFENNEEMKTI